ncbi:ergothioneine biosynthesis protein 1-like isoform X2 [Scyliorhinus canicula]|uniref:ergothioneine biosynthesis protein 1-like isoform X2 n=1 Tax=Scyliorhinus canicula TaxID=7830 RepID=UPI0018F6AF95|nr:ergothioneine biosynthesis protein 1-like isoform X2 [Scyliorhinus canicula]
MGVGILLPCFPGIAGEVLEYFENTYDLDETIFSALKDECSFYLCPDRLRLPLIFYYCHPSVVYINKLLIAGLIKEQVNPRFETLFETGVDEMSWDDTENYRMGGSFNWPRLSECVEYRRKVRAIVRKVIQETPLELPVTVDNPWWAIFMGLEHERIHLETSSVLIHQMPTHLVQRPPSWKYASSNSGLKALDNPLIKVPAAQVTYGKPRNFPSYGWDNEYGQMTTAVPEFEASKYLITNGEYLKFVQAGGYGRRTYWTKEGWEWRTFRQAQHPTFWVCPKGCKSGCGAALVSYSHCQPENFHKTSGGAEETVNGEQNGHLNGVEEVISVEEEMPVFRYRAMFDILPLTLDWPVEVNYHEAKAYCIWKDNGFRLLTEAEHHLMRSGSQPLGDNITSDPIFCDNLKKKSNTNLAFGSPTPVTMYPPTEAGFHDVSGNVWVWTEDHFNGLPGFDTTYLYDDFSSPCFDGRHTTILGGSWISTGDEASRFARFSFRRHFFQHLGFRLARTCNLWKTPVRVLNIQTLVPDNPITVPKDSVQLISVPSANTQMYYETDIAVQDQLELEYRDLSKTGYCSQLFGVCKQAIEKEQLTGSTGLVLGSGTGLTSFMLTQLFHKVIGIDYSGRFIETAQQLKCSGHQGSEIKIPDYLDRDRVVFKQLTWIPNEVGHHSFILLDFLDRTFNPSAWLVRLSQVVQAKGLVVIASEKWSRNNLDQRFQELGKQLSFVEQKEIESREKQRKRVTFVTIWKRWNPIGSECKDGDGKD